MPRKSIPDNEKENKVITLQFKKSDNKHMEVYEYLKKKGRGMSEAAIDLIYNYINNQPEEALSDDTLTRLTTRMQDIIDFKFKQINVPSEKLISDSNINKLIDQRINSLSFDKIIKETVTEQFNVYREEMSKYIDKKIAGSIEVEKKRGEVEKEVVQPQLKIIENANSYKANIMNALKAFEC